MESLIQFLKLSFILVYITHISSCVTVFASLTLINHSNDTWLHLYNLEDESWFIYIILYYFINLYFFFIIFLIL